uniref:Transmembrane protein n=1 Tax=Loa loa TaxID=7209 RepID=A0A1I7VD94_LOALO
LHVKYDVTHDVVIARLSYPFNLSRTMQDLQFIIIVIASSTFDESVTDIICTQLEQNVVVTILLQFLTTNSLAQFVTSVQAGYAALNDEILGNSSISC